MGDRTTLAYLAAVTASVVSVGAGIYLLVHNSALADQTVFDVMMHGIGAYFVARGLWMFAELLPREND